MTSSGIFCANKLSRFCRNFVKTRKFLPRKFLPLKYSL